MCLAANDVQAGWRHLRLLGAPLRGDVGIDFEIPKADGGGLYSTKMGPITDKNENSVERLSGAMFFGPKVCSEVGKR